MNCNCGNPLKKKWAYRQCRACLTRAKRKEKKIEKLAQELYSSDCGKMRSSAIAPFPAFTYDERLEDARKIIKGV